MKLKSMELKNYKAHKHFVAEFDSKNKLIQGNKGSGKTSIQDAFFWIMTGSLVDDPTPVDENGVIIEGLTISAKATFEDDSTLMIESNRTFNKKGKLTGRHKQTLYINEVPSSLTEYQAYLDSKYGSLVKRRSMLNPDWFAYGDGLRVTGANPKSDWQVRREMVTQASGSEDIEKSIVENDNKIKRAKHSLSQLKKDLDETNAGIESLFNAKHDTSMLDLAELKDSLDKLNKDKEANAQAMASLDNDEQQSVLKRALSDAQTTLSQEHSNYMLSYNSLLEKAQEPLREYQAKLRKLNEELDKEVYAKRNQDSKREALLKEINIHEQQLQERLNLYKEVSSRVYVPETTTCVTCNQALPADRIVQAEAQWKVNNSNQLENLVKEGSALRATVTNMSKELELLNKTFEIDAIRDKISKLVEPKVEEPTRWELTDQYKELSTVVENARLALTNNNSSDAKAIYERANNAIDEQIREAQASITLFDTNVHLDKQIELKSQELQALASQQDKQKDIVEECNEFTRKTLNALEEKIQETFPGLRFEMFKFTLDGDQVDTCETYGLTDNGFIPWQNLSGGQKRSATIKLANAFKKAWGVEVPLFIDDTQIYTDDEINADMQLIRITEVPYAQLEVR